MANDLTHNPLILDTSATVYATGANRVKFKKARLVTTGATPALQQVSVQDGAGREIASLAVNASQVTDTVDLAGLLSYPMPDGLVVVMTPSPLTQAKLHLYCG